VASRPTLVNTGGTARRVRRPLLRALAAAGPVRATVSLAAARAGDRPAAAFARAKPRQRNRNHTPQRSADPTITVRGTRLAATI